MATTITLDPPPAAEPEHARFLSDVRRRHRPIVLALSRQVLGLEGAAPLRRWRHWWMEPLLYTLEGRTNFFRCAFAFGMAELAGHPAVGPCAATAGEIAWSCTLMLDDMVDYCGGSTESVTRYGDFHARRVTFPIIVLWEAPLTESERASLRRHFHDRTGASTLTLDELFRLFAKYGTLDRCLELMRRQAADALSAVRRPEGIRRCPSVSALLEAWPRYQVELAEQRVQSATMPVSEAPGPQTR